MCMYGVDTYVCYRMSVVCGLYGCVYVCASYCTVLFVVVVALVKFFPSYLAGDILSRCRAISAACLAARSLAL